MTTETVGSDAGGVLIGQETASTRLQLVSTTPDITFVTAER
jgi:hypothetical protein